MASLMGSMGSSSNEKRTSVSNVSQAAEGTTIGSGTTQVGQVLLTGGRNVWKGNLTLRSQSMIIEKTGATIPTVTGSSDSEASGSSGIGTAQPHILGLTWIQWAAVGAVALGIYWF